MSLLPTQFQILSDLHLETPITMPSYATFSFSAQGTNLCLLGDIGLVKDDALFAFLRRLLEQNRGQRIFYVLGNHEPYQTSLEFAVRKLRDFEDKAKEEYGGRFIFLNRNRYDIDGQTTILGCTLWSSISPEQAEEAQLRLTDFNHQRGIQGWSLQTHLEEHRRDVDWLNLEVQKLQDEEPERQIAILTHHSPSLDPRAIAPQHRESSISTGFATDLSSESCWISPAVKLWAFGHTHYNCSFYDSETGKMVVANQKGYTTIGKNSQRKKHVKVLTVEVDIPRWKIVNVNGGESETTEQFRNKPLRTSSSTIRKTPENLPKPSLFQRAAKRAQAFARLERK